MEENENKIPFFNRHRIFSGVLIGIAAGCILRFFVFDVMYISGDSMFPALKGGDLVVLNKLAYGIINPFGGDYFFRWGAPLENDIVIFPMNNRYVIKRCVAAGGEALEFSGGREYSLIVGKKNIPLTESQYQRLKHAEYVPSDMIFVLGDNPAVSTDSRDYGFLSVDNIRGKIVWK
jgi:signal peptidase I